MPGCFWAFWVLSDVAKATLNLLGLVQHGLCIVRPIGRRSDDIVAILDSHMEAWHCICNVRPIGFSKTLLLQCGPSLSESGKKKI